MVDRAQRFTKARRCPVCGGCEQDSRGQGKRCTGYLSTDGKYVHCSREEKAGGLPQEAEGTYAHRLGECNCGTTHGTPPPTEERSGTRIRHEYVPIEAVYPYVDERGDLLFEVVRKEGKRFMQRRPDGAGGYVWKLENVRRVLYRLPALMGADPEAPVFVAEGEKDVDNLRRAGLVATTNPHGAGKWKVIAEHAQGVLRGRDVVILPDADEKGEEHARDVAKWLQGHARSVLVMPAFSGSKDVSDWLAAGHSAKELLELVAAQRAKRDAPKPAEQAQAVVKGDWTYSLLRGVNADGSSSAKLRAVTANLITILANDPAWKSTLAYNDFAECVVTLRPPPWRDQDRPRETVPGEWTELDTARLQAWASEHYALDLSDGATVAAVRVIADRVHIHPVRDRLDALKRQWDGKKRLATWLIETMGAADTPLTRAVSTAWLVSVVARVYQPGCQVDTIMVLEGKPGLRKSSILRTLIGDEWFFEMAVSDITNKDAMQVLRCKLVGEFPEIDSLSRHHWGNVKAFITRPTDRYRESYGHRARDFKRQVTFCASTNKGRSQPWITDETGGTGRRVWPIECTRGDEDSIRWVKDNRDQLFAEAVVRYESKEPWHFIDPALVQDAQEEQQARFQSHPWEPLIANWLNAPPAMGMKPRSEFGVTTTEVALGAIPGLDASKLNTRVAADVAGILVRLGWVNDGRQERRNGARVRLYRPEHAGKSEEDLALDNVRPLPVAEPIDESEQGAIVWDEDPARQA